MTTALPYDESVLLQEIADGSQAAFKTLFDAYRSRLYTYISGLVKSQQVAEELVMDVFTKLWVGRELLTEIKNFDAFLFRVAHNKTIDFFRSAARDQKFTELLWEGIQAASDMRADATLYMHEYEEKLREAINLLSPQRKKVYQMSRELDLTHDQIAARLQLSKATVNNHLVEAKQFIRSYLVSRLDIATVFVFFLRN
ncbi:MAG: RNA polymerase sigma-70 factor [Agriterribacter sp.]